jgi:Putative lumazine-binding
MKPKTIQLAIGALALAIPLMAVRTSNPDEEAIRKVVGYYFDGGRNGDSATVAKAFNKVAIMFFVRDSLVQVPIFPDYLNRVARPAGSAPDQTVRKIVSIDITGTAAVAKLELTTANAVLTDYMSLLKINNEWKIVNKIFDRRMTAGSP